MSPNIPRARRPFPGDGHDTSDLDEGKAHFHCAEHGLRDPSQITFDVQKCLPLCVECLSQITYCLGPRTAVLFGRCSECGESLTYTTPAENGPTLRELHRRECPAAITCPVCDMTSYHPEDIRHGYCGHCHKDTSEGRKVTHGRGKRLD